MQVAMSLGAFRCPSVLKQFDNSLAIFFSSPVPMRPRLSNCHPPWHLPGPLPVPAPL